jgi:hypothetical protein
VDIPSAFAAFSPQQHAARGESDSESYGEDVYADADEHEPQRERLAADRREWQHHVLHKKINGDTVQDAAWDGVLDEKRHETAGYDEHRRGAVGDYEVAEESEKRGGESAIAGALAKDAAGDSLQQRNRFQSERAVYDERGEDVENAA